MARPLSFLSGPSSSNSPHASSSHPVSRKRDVGTADPPADSQPPRKKKRFSNGHTNGINGTANGYVNGHGKFNGKLKSDGSPSILEQRRTLPIWSAKNSLIKEISENDVVVVLGETGSGKTTQIPQFIHEAGICKGKLMIAVTQPRKVAATSLAARVSTEQNCNLGTLVGYSVRFDEKSSRDTRIKYMTDGMLGRELLTDPMLSRYGVIIVDEAHERTLRTDILLTALKGILAKRNSPMRLAAADGNYSKDTKGKGRADDARDLPQLKVIVMSATLDAQRFSDFFNGAKILYVKGRQHPVKILHTAEPQSDYLEASLQTFYQIHTEQPPGDVLIFLPGQEDIESLSSSIESLAERIPHDEMQVLVCPMYAALPPSMQTKVFGRTPGNTRKVVLATNIAETSITIPGVKYVIDTGLCKEKRYYPRGKGNGVDALLIQNISKSSALQRTGRAGREGEGWCFRLYTEGAYAKLQEAAVPEIQRCNLTFAVLQMKCLGQNPETADFMDAPSRETVTASLMILFSLGALDAKGNITPMGRRMSSFPLDPPQSRAILESTKHGSTSTLVTLLALLSTSGKVFYASKDREAETEARLKFRHWSGDHMTLVNVLRAYEDVIGGQAHTRSDNGNKVVVMGSDGKASVRKKGSAVEWCKVNFINERALKEALNIWQQLRECCNREGIDWKATDKGSKEVDEKEVEGVLKALLSGLWQNTALITPDGSYKQVLGQEPVKIHPSSSLFGKKCPAIMYNELVFTSNTYAMGVSSIPQAWLTELPFFSRQRPPLKPDETSKLR